MAEIRTAAARPTDGPALTISDKEAFLAALASMDDWEGEDDDMRTVWKGKECTVSNVCDDGTCTCTFFSVNSAGDRLEYPERMPWTALRQGDAEAEAAPQNNFKVGRVQLLDISKYLEEAFAKVESDDSRNRSSGYSEEKMFYCSYEADLIAVYADGTVTCAFDDGKVFDYPFEAIKEQLSVKPPLPGWETLCNFASVAVDAKFEAEALGIVDKALKNGAMLRSFSKQQAETPDPKAEGIGWSEVGFCESDELDSEERVTMLTKMLAVADKDGDGALDFNELFAFLKSLQLIKTEDFSTLKHGELIFGEMYCAEVTVLSGSGLSELSCYCTLELTDNESTRLQKHKSSTQEESAERHCDPPPHVPAKNMSKGASTDWYEVFAFEGSPQAEITVTLWACSEESDGKFLGEVKLLMQDLLDKAVPWDEGGEFAYPMTEDATPDGELKLSFRTAKVGEDLPEPPPPPEPEAIGDVIVGGVATVKKKALAGGVWLRSAPEYPGWEHFTGGELYSGTKFEFSEVQVVLYEHQDMMYRIYYYCLTDGRGWAPDFDEDEPGIRSIVDEKNEELHTGPGIMFAAQTRGYTGQGVRRTLRAIMDSTQVIDSMDNEMSLAEAIEGKYTLFFCVASWCPSCKDAMKELTQFWSEGLDQCGLQVIVVFGDRHDKEEDFNTYRKMMPFLTVKYDEWLARGELNGVYGSNGFPWASIIDDLGRIFRKYSVLNEIRKNPTGDNFPECFKPEVWYPTAEYDEAPKITGLTVYETPGEAVWSSGKHTDFIYETPEFPNSREVPGVKMQEGEPFSYDRIQKYHQQGGRGKRGDDYDVVFYRLTDGRGWVCGFEQAPQETDKSGDVFKARVVEELGTPLTIFTSAVHGGTAAGGELLPGEEFEYTSKAIYPHVWHNYHYVDSIMYNLADDRGWVGDHGKLAEGDESDDEDRPRYIEELDGGGAEVRHFRTGVLIEKADEEKIHERREASIARWRAKMGEEGGSEDPPVFEVGDPVLWLEEDEDILKGTVGEVARVEDNGKLKVNFENCIWSFWPHQLKLATDEDIENLKTMKRAFGLRARPFVSKIIKELEIGMKVVKNLDRWGKCESREKVGEVVDIQKEESVTFAMVDFSVPKWQLGSDAASKAEHIEKLAQHQLKKATPNQILMISASQAEVAAKFEARQAARRKWQASQAASADVVHEVSSWGPSEPSDPSIASLVDELFAKGEKFEDPDFDIDTMEKTLPDQTKAFLQKQPEHAWKGRHPGHEWKRPEEIAGNFSLWHVDTGLPNCSEISQGDNADCWFISAVSVLAVANPEMIKHRFCGCYPHVGLYVVSFYKGGEWVEVTIDDRLLTTGNAVMFARDKIAGDGLDIWLPLLEKAYAKLHGGYAALELGRQEDALLDLAGAVPAAFTPEPDQGEAILARFAQCAALRAMPLLGVSTSEEETGLSPNHQYSVLELIDKREAGLPLLLLCRNPYGSTGSAGGYKGPWGNKSEEWTEDAQDVLDLNPAALEINGMFLIPYEDALRIMTRWRYSVLLPSDFFRIKLQGEWTSDSAGGGTRPDLMATNPQFLLTIPEPDAVDTQYFGQLSLEQEDVRLAEKGSDLSEENWIGIRVYKTEGGARIPAERFQSAPFLSSGAHKQARIVSRSLENIPPGEYVVVPQTWKAGKLGKFILSAWVSYAVDLVPLEADPPAEE